MYVGKYPVRYSDACSPFLLAGVCCLRSLHSPPLSRRHSRQAGNFCWMTVLFSSPFAAARTRLRVPSNSELCYNDEAWISTIFKSFLTNSPSLSISLYFSLSYEGRTAYLLAKTEQHGPLGRLQLSLRDPHREIIGTVGGISGAIDKANGLLGHLIDLVGLDTQRLDTLAHVDDIPPHGRVRGKVRGTRACETGGG
jgi:hypothetical protein